MKCAGKAALKNPEMTTGKTDPALPIVHVIGTGGNISASGESRTDFLDNCVPVAARQAGTERAARPIERSTCDTH